MVKPFWRILNSLLWSHSPCSPPMHVSIKSRILKNNSSMNVSVEREQKPHGPLSLTHAAEFGGKVSDEVITGWILWPEYNKMDSAIKYLGRKQKDLIRNHNALKFISSVWLQDMKSIIKLTTQHYISFYVWAHYKWTYLSSLEPLTWNIHITAVHRPSMAIMWLIHFGNIRPFICPWVVALHSSLKKKTKGEKRKKSELVESRSRYN